MRHLIFALAFAFSLNGQSIFFNANYNSTQAATPTFSPTAGAVSSGTVVTISTTTPTCSSYIYWSTTNAVPTTSDTHSTSATITDNVTVYAKVIGCPAATDSSVGSAAYTLATVFTEPFTGSGALSSSWSNIPSMAVGSGTVVRASDVAQISAGFKTGAALVNATGGTFARAQSAQVDIVSLTGSGNYAAICILMDTSGNGYCWKTNGILQKYTAGTPSSLTTGCGANPTVGSTIRLESNSSGLMTVSWGGSTRCTFTDTTFTSGAPGLVVGNANTGTATDVRLDNFQGQS